MFLVFIFDDEQNIIAALYKKHYKTMLYTSTRIIGEARAEEALHDVFVKLIEKFEKNISDLRDKPALYFVIIVRNHSLNLIGKEKIEELPLEDEYLFVAGSSPDEQIAAKEDEEALIRLVRSLHPTMREVLEYRYILGYSNAEIAKELKTDQNVISSRIDRAKKALRKKLEERKAQNADD